ncbi:hypothetical protein A8926_2699 [Saccharopolyspora spinosa]|uniref:Uncharacterized protein n=1 Tax=Saccharopolyspora spinosa TaxID=60894 RepID=A0A2N3XWM4_SACSN|nr:hypothetical protein A8926_2699 [Saccharopolyspora spinosa]
MAAAGFTTTTPPSPHDRNVDRLLQHWRRTSRPAQIDEQQRVALGLCLDVAELDPLGHRWGPTRQPDFRRSFFAEVHANDPDHTPERRHEPALIDAFTDLWDLYLRHGYVLCDRDDEFRLRTVCLYLSRQAKSLTVSLEDILRTATQGPTPQWQSLRTQLR